MKSCGHQHKREGEKSIMKWWQKLVLVASWIVAVGLVIAVIIVRIAAYIKFIKFI
ncbi:MAG: hypothetical protein NC123_15550 [Butyrivibrio sp.]|nr:hypothetical protein [Acetatifactor muris]MCM1560934.1 hypothetical protein [Butyrivibrio sp.]